jgi:hypothetical protein
MINSIFLFLTQSLLFLCCMTTAQAEPPERTVFPYENTADARGLLNVLTAFRAACLAQPVTGDLPARLVPESYQVVTRDVHLRGTKVLPPLPDTAILSKTGREDSDLAGGYPIIDFDFPYTDLPDDGDCKVRWKRRWDQDHPDGDPGGARRLDMAALLPARVSFYVKATLISNPDSSPGPSFYVADSYPWLFSKWRTECYKTKLCHFYVRADFDQEGLYVEISRWGEF